MRIAVCCSKCDWKGHIEVYWKIPIYEYRCPKCKSGLKRPLKGHWSDKPYINELGERKYEM